MVAIDNELSGSDRAVVRRYVTRAVTNKAKRTYHCCVSRFSTYTTSRQKEIEDKTNQGIHNRHGRRHAASRGYKGFQPVMSTSFKNLRLVSAQRSVGKIHSIEARQMQSKKKRGGESPQESSSLGQQTSRFSRQAAAQKLCPSFHPKLLLWGREEGASFL